MGNSADPSQECEYVGRLVQLCAEAGCPQQCEEAELRKATDSSIATYTSLGTAAVLQQVPESTALHVLTQFVAGAEPSATAVPQQSQSLVRCWNVEHYLV